MPSRLNLVAALEAAIHNPDDDWGRDRLHVSDLAVAIEEPGDRKCPRQLWLRLKGYESKPVHAGQQMMFDAGHRLHAAAVEWLREGLPEGWSVKAAECDLSHLLPGELTGRCDALLVGPMGEKVVVDFKTVRGAAFRFMTRTAKPAHVLQVQTYMMAVDASYGVVLYLDREGQNFAKQFFIERDDDAVQGALSEALVVQSMDSPPPVMEPVEKKGQPTLPWQCSWCSYLEVSCPGAFDMAGQAEAMLKEGAA